MHKITSTFAVAAILLLFLPLAPAAVETVTLHVRGMACPFCAYGIEKQLKKLDGTTERYQADIEAGTITLGWVEDQPLDLQALKRAVQKAGFSTGDIEATVSGRLERQGEGERLIWYLVPDGLEQRFALFQQPAQDGDDASVSTLDERTSERVQQAADADATMRIRGAVHSHEEGPVGLNVDSLEVVDQEQEAAQEPQDEQAEE